MNFEPIIEIIIDFAVKILFTVALGFVTAHVIPWLKEKRLYDTVVKMVQAAEKWSKTHNIDKKTYVIEQLEAKGVKVNSIVEALIESAVQELDIALAGTGKPRKVDAGADEGEGEA